MAVYLHPLPPFPSFALPNPTSSSPPVFSTVFPNGCSQSVRRRQRESRIIGKGGARRKGSSQGRPRVIYEKRERGMWEMWRAWRQKWKVGVWRVSSLLLSRPLSLSLLLPLSLSLYLSRPKSLHLSRGLWLELMTRTTAHSRSLWTRRLFTSKVRRLPHHPPLSILHSHSHSCVAVNHGPSVCPSGRPLSISTPWPPSSPFTRSVARPARGLVCRDREGNARAHTRQFLHRVEERGEHPGLFTSAELREIGADWRFPKEGPGVWAICFHGKPASYTRDRGREPLLHPLPTPNPLLSRLWLRRKITAVEPLGIIREYCWARSWAQVRRRCSLSSAAAVVLCVATSHLTGTRLTPCQQSHHLTPLTPPPLPPVLSTLPSLFGRKSSRTLPTSFFFLFCSPPFSSFISVPPSVHLYSSLSFSSSSFSSSPLPSWPPTLPHTSPPPPPRLVSSLGGHQPQFHGPPASLTLFMPSPMSVFRSCMLWFYKRKGKEKTARVARYMHARRPLGGGSQGGEVRWNFLQSGGPAQRHAAKGSQTVSGRVK